MHLILLRISYYRQRVGTNGVQRGLTTFLLSFSFLYRYLSLLLLASVFLPLLHWFIFFYFSPFSRQFVAGENLRVAGDIAGRRRFLTTLQNASDTLETVVSIHFQRQYIRSWTAD